MLERPSGRGRGCRRLDRGFGVGGGGLRAGGVLSPHLHRVQRVAHGNATDAWKETRGTSRTAAAAWGGRARPRSPREQTLPGSPRPCRVSSGPASWVRKQAQNGKVSPDKLLASPPPLRRGPQVPRSEGHGGSSACPPESCFITSGVTLAGPCPQARQGSLLRPQAVKCLSRGWGAQTKPRPGGGRAQSPQGSGKDFLEPQVSMGQSGMQSFLDQGPLPPAKGPSCSCPLC